MCIRDRILRVNHGDEIYEFLAPPDLWSRQRETGRTTAEIFGEAGLSLTKTSNNLSLIHI